MKFNILVCRYAIDPSIVVTFRLWRILPTECLWFACDFFLQQAAIISLNVINRMILKCWSVAFLFELGLEL